MSQPLGRSEFGDPANKGRTISRDDAINLLNDWVKNDRLRLHMRQVAHLMKCWAREKELLDEAGQWQWEMAGLLHDADWDQWPDDHCRLAAILLGGSTRQDPDALSRRAAGRHLAYRDGRRCWRRVV